MEQTAQIAADWLVIGKVDEIPQRGARRLKVAGLEIGVFRTQDDRIFAIDNKCPHKKGPLTEGIVHETGVTCPLHSWVIDLETGEARGADSGCVKTHEVNVKDGVIYLKVTT